MLRPWSRCWGISRLRCTLNISQLWTQVVFQEKPGCDHHQPLPRLQHLIYNMYACATTPLHCYVLCFETPPTHIVTQTHTHIVTQRHTHGAVALYCSKPTSDLWISFNCIMATHPPLYLFFCLLTIVTIILTWYLLLPPPLLRRTRHMMTRKAARQEKKRIAMKRPCTHNENMVVIMVKATMQDTRNEFETSNMLATATNNYDDGSSVVHN